MKKIKLKPLTLDALDGQIDDNGKSVVDKKRTDVLQTQLEVTRFVEECEKFLEKIPMLEKDSNPEGTLGEMVETFRNNTAKFNEVTTLINVYDKLKHPAKIKLANQVFANYLKVAKTVYEISDSYIITNEQYDKMLAVYLEKGNVEDTPTAATVKKKIVGDEMKGLQNNLIKAHTVYEKDEVPSGVSKEHNKSLESFFSNKDIKKDTKFNVRITPKIDGVSISALIEDGVIVEALTRGDERGSSIIYGLHGMRVLPAGKYPNLAVQFEAFMTYEDVARLTEDTMNKYFSVRGAAAGIVHRLLKEEAKELRTYLSFYPIRAMSTDDEHRIQSFPELMKDLYIGPTGMIKHQIFNLETKEDILTGIAKARDELSLIRAELGYPIDGIVITILNKDVQKSLGRSGRTNNYEIALKFPPKEAIGIIKGYSLSIGLMGGRNIVMELQNPVTIDERNFSKISTSVAEFEAREYAIGDKVEVVIVGDVIPSISKIIEKSENEKLPYPTQCPHCSSELEMSGGKFYCMYDGCNGVKIKQLENFMIKLGVDGFSEKTAEKLYQSGATEILDLLHRVENQRNTDDKLARVYDAIYNKMEDINDALLLESLGIPKLGSSTAKKILSVFSLDELINNNENEISNRMQEENGIGKSIVFIINGIKGCIQEIEIMKKYSKRITIKKDAIKVATTNLAPDINKTVRGACEETEQYEFINSKAFNILVVENEEAKNPDSKTAKLRLAIDKDLKVLTVDEFLELVSETDNNNILETKTNSDGKASSDVSSTGTIPNTVKRSIVGFNWKTAV